MGHEPDIFRVLIPAAAPFHNEDPSQNEILEDFDDNLRVDDPKFESTTTQKNSLASGLKFFAWRSCLLLVIVLQFHFGDGFTHLRDAQRMIFNNGGRVL